MPKPKFSLVFALAAARASVALLAPSHVIILSRDRVKHHPRRPQRLGGMEDRDNAWSSSGGSSDRRGEDAEEVSVVEITGSHDGPAVEKPFNWESMASNDNYVWYLKDWNKNKKRPAGSASPRKGEIQTSLRSPVTIAAIMFFVPVFSAEFFFSISRQFLCAGSWGGDLCGAVQ